MTDPFIDYYFTEVSLPKDPDGVVRNKIFVHSTFHHTCKNLKFEGCLWLDCDGVELKNSDEGSIYKL